MNAIDIFYNEVVSRETDSLFDTDSEGIPHFNEELKTFLNPLEFEAHIIQSPESLWAAKFRRARDIVKECLSRCEDCELRDILLQVMICLQTLAKEYIPRFADEIGVNVGKDGTHDNTEQLPAEMAKVNKDSIRIVFGELESAGFLSKEWQFSENMTEDVDRAFLAESVLRLLGVYRWRKVASSFWNLKNPGQDLNQMSSLSDQRKRIESTIAAAVSKSEVLRKTERGKNLLAKYKIYR